MVDTLISWTDPNIAEEGYRIYRAAANFDFGYSDLASTAMTQVGAGVTQTILNRPLGAVGNYRVGTVFGGKVTPEWLSPLVKRCGGDLDLFIDFTGSYETTFRKAEQDSPSVNSLLTEVSPACLILNAAGDFVISPINTPNRTDVGLYTNPTRSNFAPNSSMAGADPATGAIPNMWAVSAYHVSVARSAILLKTYKGLPMVGIRYTGTSTTTSSGPAIRWTTGPSVIPVSAGEVITNSAFIQVEIVSGSVPTGVALRTEYFTDAARNSIISSNLALDGSIQQYVTTGVVPSDGTNCINPGIGFGFVSGQYYDVIFWIAAPQVERGAFATAPILTTSGTITRTGTRTSLPVPARNGTAFIIDFDLLEPPTSTMGNRRILAYKDATANSAQLSDRFQIHLNTSGVPQIDGNTVGYPGVLANAGSACLIGRNIIYGVAYPNYWKIGRVGGTDGSTLTTAPLIPNIATLGIGTSLLGTGQNTHMRVRSVMEILDESDPAAAFAKVKTFASGIV